VASELAKLDLDLRREANAVAWETEWRRDHVPTIDLMRKVDGKWIIDPCPHCEALARGK
jgi:hypothetical protein